MPFFAKVILFFSVPAVMFALLAVPSLQNEPVASTGDAWRPLAATGFEYSVPAGWRVADPLTTDGASFDERWTMGWPARQNVAAAALIADNLDHQGVAITVFHGPRVELEPLALESDSYYQENVMIERADTEQWSTLDGLELRVERARYLPGPLAGADSTMLLAWGSRDGRTLVVNAGGPTDSFDLEAVRATLSAFSVPR